MKKQDVIRAWRDGEFPTVEESVLSSVTGGCSINNCPTSAICSPCPPKHCY